MNQPPYTSEEMKGKYICAFVSLCGSRPVLDCVRYASGEREGKPYLYKSVAHASFDKHFDPDYDEVIPAQEYFERLKIKRKAVTNV